MSNELQKIDFHGDNIIAFKDDETEEIYANLKGICISLGVSFQGQHKKLTADPAYENALRYQPMLTPSGVQEALFVNSNYIHG